MSDKERESLQEARDVQCQFTPRFSATYQDAASLSLLNVTGELH